MVKRVRVPRYLWRGIRENHNGFNPRFRVFGGDVETVQGEPYTLQLADSAENVQLFWVNRENVLDQLLRYLEPRLLDQGFNVCYFHFLQFDLTAIFLKYQERFKRSHFRFKVEGVDVEIWSGRRWFARITYESRRVLWLLDSWAFVFCSLAKIAESLKLPIQKLEKPEGLGEKALVTDQFIEYAKQDARLSYLVGKWIVSQHQEYDVRMCVSLPQFAARVLRHHFFRKGESIALPPGEIQRGALLSYHGGKNGCYVRPGFYKGVVEADLNSAYPWAMSTLPQMVAGRYEFRKTWDPEHVGIWCITGRVVGRCPYPIFFTHDFQALRSGESFRNLWVTGDELKEAFKHGEGQINSLYGWVWVPSRNYPNNPLARYVQTFYEKKNSTLKDDPQRLLYKLLLNSLYGKFIQTIEEEEPLDVLHPNGAITFTPGTYKAGGVYQPFLATLITGRVRARMHDLEVRYEALHTATDSIKTRQDIAETNGLGGLGKVVKGDCLILRNKLYVHFDETGGPPKAALHGFEGSWKDLIGMVKSGKHQYAVKHLWRVREALRCRVPPLSTTMRERVLNVEYPPRRSAVDVVVHRRPEGLLVLGLPD